RKERKLPPLLFTLGTEDDLIDTESVERFLRALHEAGHTDTRFWLHRGRPHAFLDSGSNKALGISFERDAVPALDVIIEFIDGCMHG
ncbi:MAG: alpha/beta hydrolase, partial [Spirochaetota bacterium]